MDQLALRAEEADFEAAESNDLVEEHTERLRNVSDLLVLSRERLEHVINSSEIVINDAVGVSLVIDEAELILNEIQVNFKIA